MHKWKWISIDLEIKENLNCKINSLFLDIKNDYDLNIKFYCQSFENLSSISISNVDRIKNINDSFPIFNPENKKIFKSLENLSIYGNTKNEMNLEILDNLYSNIKYMPNLKILNITGYFKNIKKEFYENFIKKILELKLDSIYILVFSNKSQNTNLFYSFEELKTISSDINNYYFKNIMITKLSNNNINFCQIN